MEETNIELRISCFDTRKVLMQLQGCRTGVRRGSTQGAVGDAAAHASVPRRCFFFFSFLVSRGLGADSGRFMPIQVESVHIGWPKLTDSSRTGQFKRRFSPILAN